MLLKQLTTLKQQSGQEAESRLVIKLSVVKIKNLERIRNLIEVRSLDKNNKQC